MNHPVNILVIDDEPVMRDSCYQVLSRRGCDVVLSDNGYDGLKELGSRCFDVVILDLVMPDLSGYDILEKIHETNPEINVIIITGHPTVEGAVRAMKLGAYDFIPKPFTPNMLRSVVTRSLERQRYEDNQSGPSIDESSHGVNAIIGESPVISELKQLIIKAAHSDCSVLVTGETGTGKELVARALHHYSKRRKNPFITIDSGGLVDTLVESELFGHIKGAYTGAVTNRVGRFEQAHSGTLFFDEISNMSMRIQGKLLRVLQEKEIARIGSSEMIPVDVRIIAATNRNLMREIKNGTFREDLYYRLNVIPLVLPPLRDRREDIPLLTQYFLDRFRSEYKSRFPEKISSGAMKAMMEYTWPGNVRELEHMIKRIVALCDDREVDPFALLDGQVTPYPDFHKRDAFSSPQLDDVERSHIERILKKFRYNKSRTAEALGIDRKTLRLKIRKYQISDSNSYIS